MSNEAKALGIRRGVPFYQIKQLAGQHGIAVFSGNHRLYGDMSSRVMATLSSLVPDIEIYSVDEAFLHLHQVGHDRLVDEGREIVRRVRRDVGIPTSLGIAPTKTLAKLAARFAKLYPGYRSVCMIDDDAKRRKALALTDVGDVWGIGRKLTRKMPAYGIRTALDLADMTEEQVGRILNITGLRTWRELNGTPCIGADAVDADHRQICVSRTFGRSLTDLSDLVQAISSFTAIAGRKLRHQQGRACSISAFIHTNAYRHEQEQYYSSATRTLEEPTDDTLTLTREAVAALTGIYRSGYFFKKAGVLINEIVHSDSAPLSLFVDNSDRERRARLMGVIDSINAGCSTADTVHVASIDSGNPLIRHGHMSPLYSTRLSDVITVKTHR